jgi:hypothetical protein
MPFHKGDPNINRNGRPKNAEAEMLRQALKKEGHKQGEDFWEMVARKSWSDKAILITILRKLLPDQIIQEPSEGSYLLDKYKDCSTEDLRVKLRELL